MIYSATQELEIPEAVVVPALEGLTGADFMVSPAKMPPTSAKLVERHIEMGAVLIQRKSGMDLISSLGPRLDDSLATMRTIPGIAPFQCVLMFCGAITVAPSGMAVIDGRFTETPYINVISAIDAWNMRGGTFIWLKDNSFVPEFLLGKEKRIIQYLDKQTKQVYPPPLQNLELVNDYRVTLATFPLIGEGRANRIRDHLVKNKMGDSLLQALIMMTNGDIVQPDGTGATIRAAVREWLGLPDGWNLDIKPIEEKHGS
jgi:hypothetical protein